MSTRGKAFGVPLSKAILMGLAPDGGLYVPQTLPRFRMDDFGDTRSWQEISLKMLLPFFERDQLEPMLEEIINASFNFPLPLVEFEDRIEVLELFHGPTGAFKDVGARFLARCFDSLGENRMILVATSGDTGSAVASAFHGLEFTSVSVFFPKGKISPFQEQQLTCWDNNVYSFRVRSDFDGCQKFVKELFSDQNLNRKYAFSSANSINIGRLLPQCTYYAFASLDYYRRKGIKPKFVVPTGNMGNALACIWTREMGFPISDIILATNANDTIPTYFRTGKFTPKQSVRTIANAMDVGNPSNMERFLHFGNPEKIKAESIPDEKIVETIRSTWQEKGMIIDPHTATAVSLAEPNSIVVSTAHPSKFKEIVEPIVGTEIDIPLQLSKMLERPVNFKEIDPSIPQFTQALESFRSERGQT